MSESKLWPALLRARQNIGPIPKTARNPHFGNKYAPLDAILAAVNPPLWAEGLILTGEGDGVSYVATTVVHAETGQSHSVRVPLVGLSDMQKVGGALTYAQRYGIGVLLGLELDDDDDGNAASHKPAPTASKVAPQAPISRPQGSGAKPNPAPPQNRGKGKFAPCPLCGASAVIKGKPEFGGGMICWKKEGGCGNKFTDELWAEIKDDKPMSKPQAGYSAPEDVDDDLGF